MRARFQVIHIILVVIVITILLIAIVIRTFVFVRTAILDIADISTRHKSRDGGIFRNKTRSTGKKKRE